MNCQFKNVIISPQLHCFSDIFKIIVIAQNDKPYSWIVRRTFGDQVKSIHRLHFQICQNDMRLILPDLFKRLFSI